MKKKKKPGVSAIIYIHDPWPDSAQRELDEMAKAAGFTDYIIIETLEVVKRPQPMDPVERVGWEYLIRQKGDVR